MTTAFLGLGSNLGDREAALRGGRAALGSLPGIKVAAASALYETEPVGGPRSQEEYLNAVLRVKTGLSAPELLHACQTVEKSFGRRRGQVWGPRTLDIDILFFDREIVRQEHLAIPHPQLHLRPFVLIPLLDLAPDLEHPVLEQSIRQLQARFPEPCGVRRLADHW